jgi:hypothetical protein
MFSLFAALVVQFRNAFADRRDVLLENAALKVPRARLHRTFRRSFLGRPCILPAAQEFSYDSLTKR